MFRRPIPSSIFPSSVTHDRHRRLEQTTCRKRRTSTSLIVHLAMALLAASLTIDANMIVSELVWFMVERANVELVGDRLVQRGSKRSPDK